MKSQPSALCVWGCGVTWSHAKGCLAKLSEKSEPKMKSDGVETIRTNNRSINDRIESSQ